MYKTLVSESFNPGRLALQRYGNSVNWLGQGGLANWLLDWLSSDETVSIALSIYSISNKAELHPQ